MTATEAGLVNDTDNVRIYCQAVHADAPAPEPGTPGRLSESAADVSTAIAIVREYDCEGPHVISTRVDGVWRVRFVSDATEPDAAEYDTAPTERDADAQDGVAARAGVS